MNIKEAKEEIKNAMKAYFTKNEYGEYIIPLVQQRPVFMMGAPGIGKTAIMKQIANELDVGLVSYSMTHHTRQSALGLPYIVDKVYGGEQFKVSEYTMSEIIASVYEMIEVSGHKEGILFLDEINCVSETLAPSMLQFLQEKKFGGHVVPDGWIVVTAGNPPEYNNSVREFDIVTWDRLKRIDVTPDYDAWREYAVNSGVLPVVISYLDNIKSNFYSIESTVAGKRFVTARGWSDLSTIIALYELKNFPVTLSLIQQYLQNDKIARSFSDYYQLFIKYRSSYQIEEVLEGKKMDEVVARAKSAKLDERLAVLSLLFSSVLSRVNNVMDNGVALAKALDIFKNSRMMSGGDLASILVAQCNNIEKEIQKGTYASSLSNEQRHVMQRTIKNLEVFISMLRSNHVATAADAYKLVKEQHNENVKNYNKEVEKVSVALDNAFTFLEQAFGDGNEMVIFVTELTVNTNCSKFISRHGCDKYYAHNATLLFYKREQDLTQQIDNLLLTDDDGDIE